MEQILVPSKYPGVLLVEIGDGPTLVQNSDINITIYMGDDNSVTVGNSQKNVPLTPQSFLVVDGSKEVWAIAASGNVIVNKIVGGLSFFQSGITGSGFSINSNGIFVYSTNPGAFGTLVSSEASAGGTDPYGNVYLGGNVSYFTSGGTFFAVQIGTAQQIGFYTSPAANGPWTQIASIGAGGANLILNSNNVVLFDVPTRIVDPSNPSNAETWHSVTLDAGWSNVGGNPVCSYRMTTENEIELVGFLNHASFSGTLAINGSNALAAAYRPATNQHAAINTNVGGCGVVLVTTGVINVESAPTGTTNIRFSVRLPLNI